MPRVALCSERNQWVATVLILQVRGLYSGKPGSEVGVGAFPLATGHSPAELNEVTSSLPHLGAV